MKIGELLKKLSDAVEVSSDLRKFERRVAGGKMTRIKFEKKIDVIDGVRYVCYRKMLQQILTMKIAKPLRFRQKQYENE